MKIVRYDQDGRISVVQTMDDLLVTDEFRKFFGEEKTVYLPSEEGLEADVSDLRHYVLDGGVVPRPELPAVITGSILRGVPSGASIRIGESVYEADGSEIELEFDHPGTYSLRITLWPYQDLELTHEDLPQV